MLRACSRCGRIHKSTDMCKAKRNDEVKKDEIYYFRNSQSWQKKRTDIKRRDKYLCQYCLYKLNKINNKEVSVHHIQGIRTNWENRLDDDNLITLCKIHHTQADKNIIKARTLKEIIKAIYE